MKYINNLWTAVKLIFKSCLMCKGITFTFYRNHTERKIFLNKFPKCQNCWNECWLLLKLKFRCFWRIRKLPFILIANFIETKYFLATLFKNNCQNISMASGQYLRKNVLLYSLSSHKNQWICIRYKSKCLL